MPMMGCPEGMPTSLVERGDTIKALESSLEEKGKIERDDAIEKGIVRRCP